MLNCDICKKDGHYKLRNLGQEVWACPQCASKRTDSSTEGVVIRKMVKVGSMMASESQLKALESRVILPYEKQGGGYYLGTRLASGKIRESAPDYRP